MREKICRILNVFMTVMFVIVLSIPLIFINKDIGKKSITENRTLSKFPSLMKENEFNENFIFEFEAFINDNIGFKQEAVILKIGMLYNLFNKFDVPNYIMGKDENLFYTSRGTDIVTHQGKNIFSDDDMSYITKQFSVMKSYFEDVVGSEFYFMSIPNKENIYPELYNPNIIRNSESTRMDILIEYVQKNLGMNIFSVKEALLSNKDNYELLYYKNYDCTHWNMNGAFVGYSELMRQIQKKFNDIVPVNENAINVDSRYSNGEIGIWGNIPFLNNILNFEDIIYTYTSKAQYEINTVPPEGIYFDLNSGYIYLKNENSINDKTIMIVGDSYVHSFLLDLLGATFKEVYFVKFTDIGNIMRLSERVTPDIVVCEAVERVMEESSFERYEKFDVALSREFLYNNLETKTRHMNFTIESPYVYNDTITIKDDLTGLMRISGWIIDPIQDISMGDVYVKVGKKYFLSSHIPRPDLTSMNSNYLNAGFEFWIPVVDLMENDTIEFFPVSHDYTYKFDSIIIKIEK